MHSSTSLHVRIDSTIIHVHVHVHCSLLDVCADAVENLRHLH